MNNREDIREVADFLLDFAVTLVRSGSHTSRVVRNVIRIGETFGCTLDLLVFQKTVVMTITDTDNHSVRHTSIRKIPPMVIDFDAISSLSALSWEAYDHGLSLAELREKFLRITAKPRLPEWLVLLLVCFANAAFCGLFQGDAVAMALVGAATLVGFSLRLSLTQRHVNHFIVFILCSLVSSLIASAGYAFGWGATPQTAIAVSVLYLIPGVPLINAVIDTLEGNVLIGTSRLINAVNLIVCIAIGLFFTLLITGLDKL